MGRDRRIRIVESSLEKLGRILTQKWKLRLQFRAGECHTEGRTITLPSIPDNAPKDLVEAMQGHLDHEASHVVHTDFKYLRAVGRHPKTQAIINSMEDPRIERQWGRIYPGAKGNFRRKREWCLRKMVEEREMEDPQNPGQTITARPWDQLTDLGRLSMVGTILFENNCDEHHWFFRDVVDKDLLDRFKDKAFALYKRAYEADTTEEVGECAKKLLEQLGEEDPEDPDFQLPSDGQTATGPGQGQGQDRDQSQGTNGVAGNGVDSDHGPGGGTKPSRAELEALERDQELMSPHNQLRDGARGALEGDDSYLVYTTEGDVVEPIKDGDRQKTRAFLKEAAAYVAPMKRKLARVLLTQKQARWEGGKRRGKIDPRALHRVALGTGKDVFRNQVISEGFDTCVSMMVDHSGSMHGGQLKLAAQTALVLGELFNQLGIPFSVYGFSTGDSGVSEQRYGAATADEQAVYKRWGNLWLGRYKDFDELWAGSQNRLVNMHYNGQVNTYDGESMRIGAQMLLRRPERRKILLWLNDGYPCPNYSDDRSAHTIYARQCALEIDTMVEAIAIGIGTDAVKDIFKNWVQVDNVSDLPKVALGKLSALLTKGMVKDRRKAA